MLRLDHLSRLRESMQVAPKGTGEMPFLDHLEDLRRTIIRMGITVMVAMCLCFGFAPAMMQVLRQPVDRVWESYESERLPGAVDVEDWTAAKSLAAVRAQLAAAPGSPALRELEEHFSPEVRGLADMVPLLHAAGILPEREQEAYLAAAAAGLPEGGRERLLALHESGAELREGRGREALKLMGAFQPGEAFMLSLSLSFFGGLIISFPLLMYFLLSFIIPGLLEEERKLLYKCVAAGFGLFLGGCAFAYFAVLPRVLAFFYDYSLDMGISNDWRIGYYLSFAAKLVFVFGIVFELPVIIMPLVKLGVLTYERMKATRAYALIGCLVAALFLAPAPDPGTMLIMAAPMYALYELCILFAWHDARRAARAALAEGEGEHASDLPSEAPVDRMEAP